MTAPITLSAAVQQNLLALQTISQQQAQTQERLATGKKVNSALDNPVNFFTASALTARSGELSNLLDSMNNGVQTLQAASNGLTSITGLIQTMESTATQALQDASWQSGTYTIASGLAGAKTISFSGGAVGATPITVSLDSGTQTTAALGANAAGNLEINGTTIAIGANVSSATLTSDINNANISGVTATDNNGTVTISNANGNLDFTGSTAALLTSFGLPALTQSNTVDQLVGAINGNAQLAGLVKATDNAGQLQIQNLSTSTLTLTGVTGTSIDGSAGTATIAGNTVRANLVTQFNQLRDQLDKTSADSSFNGLNLLQGDQLKLYFNEHSTSYLVIQATNAAGINNQVLGINAGTNAQFQSNTQLSTLLQTLQGAVTTVASQASAFGSNLAIVQNRQDFTNNMINTLNTGASNLTLADTNLEGANMIALQSRQQLSMTALSLANQSQSAVMRLFG